MEEKKNPWDKSAQWPEEMNLLRGIIAQTELEEMTKWGGPVYTINKKNVVGIGGFKDYVAVWFWNGVFLKDEQKLLVNANEGVTKGLRQWRFTSKEEIAKNEKLILQYMQEAIANEKAGLSIKPEKKKRLSRRYFRKRSTKTRTLQPPSPFSRHSNSVSSLSISTPRNAKKPKSREWKR
jgi:uncharacterized protein YdeI (YjbR/CyaY-like superfamily)